MDIDFQEAILNEMKELKRALGLPLFINRSKIAKKWGISNQSDLKPWQMPNFGIPEFFNGRCPMYREEDVCEIIRNATYYKEKWMRLSVKEKVEIKERFEALKNKEKVLV